MQAQTAPLQARVHSRTANLCAEYTRASHNLGLGARSVRLGSGKRAREAGPVCPLSVLSSHSRKGAKEYPDT